MDEKKNREADKASKEPPTLEAKRKAYVTDLIDDMNRDAFERLMNRRLKDADHEPPVG